MDLEKNEVIITGINGFVGEHLARHLKNSGCSITGIGRDDKPSPTVIQYIDSYQTCDLLDTIAVSALALSSAQAIIHLAGFATVSESFEKPELYIEGNAKMTDNLLSSALSQNFGGRALIVSTGAVYESSQEMPLKETSSIGSSAPYPFGKIRAEEAARGYIEKGLDIIIARPFNHIGPGQARGFLIPDMYAQLMTAKQTDETSITTGDLTTRRDYTDVRDIVRAYTMLALADTLQFDTYNIASGSSKSGEEILEAIERAAGIEKIEHITDPARLRPNDPKDITGNATRIRTELGWKPEISLDQTIQDFVDFEFSRELA